MPPLERSNEDCFRMGKLVFIEVRGCGHCL